tara:strand:+ start:278 stop:991 length:714 start_codon:yes stop_codon:yes gene_type:complete
LGIILFISCGKNEIEIPDDAVFGYEYFPLEVGYEWVYAVDSVLIIQGGTKNKVSSSFIKEELIEILKDTETEKEYKIQRSYRKDSISQWRIRNIWTIRRDERRAIRNEGNISFVKLVFPAVDGAKWDGHIFFDDEKEFPVAADNLRIYKGWEYKINNVGSKSVGGILYLDVLDIAHIDEFSFISKRFSTESYAKGIGLVERKMEIFDTQNGNESLPWIERAEKGFQLTQTLVSFKKN